MKLFKVNPLLLLMNIPCLYEGQQAINLHQYSNKKHDFAYKISNRKLNKKI
ncbi:hypothetical protein N476_21010 [Pseudoalteromonas luteoviolacea H33]|uniref:Uncharacterized protein n=1 Tax=Pseudoalteromonas luteoviolacea H33 TaxID=1365251 RepID=A0A167DDD4_9GAMM|nr:hypothetical protein N476_21010 [Pseudoalteromonas luteoviolacea H33]KZN75469.1 hypothetical protein N477_01775 [Pseudoalteromonas luteoviolacea H33-S]